jgi:two-component system CheB/CheR fusion protein
MIVPSPVEGEPKEPTQDQEKSLAEVYARLRQQAGIDFSGYKRTTMLRRIERRMALRRIGGLREYAVVLHDDPNEARALAQDMLIHVTSFFRDSDAFTTLKEQIFASLAKGKGSGDSIRLWVPGCSTGEEVYALAICLLESLGSGAENFAIKLFGTDLSDEAIETARIGRYSATPSRPSWGSRPNGCPASSIASKAVTRSPSGSATFASS